MTHIPMLCYHAKTKATGAAKQTRPYTHTCEISGDGLYSQKLPSTMNKLRNQTHEHTYKKTQTHTHTHKREMWQILNDCCPSFTAFKNNKK